MSNKKLINSPLIISSRLQFHRVINKHEIHRICEIGVFEGTYSAYLNKAFSPEQLWLIDSWIGVITSGDKDGKNVKSFKDNYLYLQVCKKFINDRNIHVLRYKSDILRIFPNNYFDLVYIDGDHSYDVVLHDLNICYKKVRCNGWILGHDYKPNLSIWKPQKDFPTFGSEIKQAVDDFCFQKGLQISMFAMDGRVSFGIINKKFWLDNYI